MLEFFLSFSHELSRSVLLEKLDETMRYLLLPDEEGDAEWV